MEEVLREKLAEYVHEARKKEMKSMNPEKFKSIRYIYKAKIFRKDRIKSIRDILNYIPDDAKLSDIDISDSGSVLILVFDEEKEYKLSEADDI